MWASRLALVGLISTAGCTNYMPVEHGAGPGTWEEARRSAYGRASGAEPRAASAVDAPASEPSPWSTSEETRRDAPVVDPMAPKPLPPMRSSTRAETPGSSPSPSGVAEPAEPRVVERPRPAEPPPAADVAALPPPALSGVGFLWPVPEVGDAARVADVGDEGALAIEAPADGPFVAAENGVVVFAGDDLAAFGKMVVVRHDGDYTTAYGHAERLDVAVGDVVRRGQRLGLIGTTGEVTTPQLYFEMRVGSRVVDPRAYLVEAPRLVAGG